MRIASHPVSQDQEVQILSGTRTTVRTQRYGSHETVGKGMR